MGPAQSRPAGRRYQRFSNNDACLNPKRRCCFAVPCRNSGPVWYFLGRFEASAYLSKGRLEDSAVPAEGRRVFTFYANASASQRVCEFAGHGADRKGWANHWSGTAFKKKNYKNHFLLKWKTIFKQQILRKTTLTRCSSSNERVRR